MPERTSAVDEVERILAEARAKLGSGGTFRLRTLLDMALLEVRRGSTAVPEPRRRSGGS